MLVVDQMVLQFGAEEEFLGAQIAIVRPGIGTVLVHVLMQTTGRRKHWRTDVARVAALVATMEWMLD